MRRMFLITGRMFLTLWLLLTTLIIAQATDYYVSTTGNDNNDGSAGSPWRTVGKAVSSVAGNSGHTIRVGAGDFPQSSIINVPSGVNLIGAGSGQTNIVVNYYYEVTTESFEQYRKTTYHPEQFVMQLNGSSQTIKGFSLNGQDRRCVGGIFAQNAVRVVFDDLNIQSFRVSALWVDRGNQDVEIKNCYIKNSTIANTNGGNGDAGNVLIDYGKNLSIHDNYIEEQGAIRPDVGGYGIKKALDETSCPWECHNRGFFEYMKIYNNVIKVPSVGGWINGLAPGITIEISSGILKECEIFNNNLDNHVSLVGHFFADLYRGKGCRIHHNYFPMRKGRYAYAIEVNMPSLEIDHNIFEGGYYPIAQFDDRRDANSFYDHFIHHNVWYDNAGGQELIHYKKPPLGGRGLLLYNNTIIDNLGVARFTGLEFDRHKGEIKNNLFISLPNARGDILGIALDDVVVSHNGFFNLTPKGSNAVTADPKLTLSGDRPTPFFALQPGSPAIDAGTPIPGFTDDAKGNPDLGAFESGVQPWQAGVITSDTQAPTAPTTLTGIPISTFVTLSWGPSYDDNFLTGYQIFQNGTLIGEAGGLTFKAEGLTPGTAYTFTVKARDFAGNLSEASPALIIATLGPDTQAPTPPGTLTATNLAPRSVTLTWTVSTDNEGINRYYVYQNGTLIDSTETTTIDVKKLEILTTYVFTVRAQDYVGNRSDASTSLSITTPEPDLDVTSRGEINENESIAKIHDGDLNSKWLDVSATSWVQFRYKTAPVWNTYQITSGNDAPERDPKNWTLKGSNDGTNWTTLDTRSDQSWPERNQTRRFRFTNTTAYKYYYVDITANNGSDLIQVSELAYSFVAPDSEAPTAPANLIASDVKAKTVALSWTASTDNNRVTGYQIFRNGASVGQTSGTSFIAAGLSPETAYQFTVKAVDEDQNVSASSNAINVTTSASSSVNRTIVEPFDYPAGDLNEKGTANEGWGNAWSKTNGQIELIDGNLGTSTVGKTAKALAGNDATYFRSLAEKWSDDGGVVWVSFYAKNTRSANTSSSSAGLSLYNGDSEDLFIGSPYEQGKIGLANSYGDRVTSVPDTNLNLITVKLVFDGTSAKDSAYLWVNYTGVNEPPTSTAQVSTVWGSDGFTKIRITSASTYSFQYDGIRMATTFAPTEDAGPGSFAIASVTTLTCETLAYDQRRVSFTPVYGGATGSPISLSVVNELLPTTAPGPYTLRLYTDNPVINLTAGQGSMVAQFSYNWLTACGTSTANTAPTVANPIATQSVTAAQAFTYVIPANTFTDVESPGTLTLSVTGLPAGVNFTAPLTISGTPSVSGVSSVTVTATDPGNLSVSTTFALAVIPAGGGSFAIASVNTLSCETLSPGQRRVSFTPVYRGVIGLPISFSVVNELLPTTAPGPYTLRLYTDNPVITLNAEQGGTAVSFSYNWLTACGSGARLGAEGSEKELTVDAYPNPVNSYVIIRQGESTGPINVTFQNGSGQALLRHQTRFKTPISIDHLTPGLYILKVQTGQQVRSLKVLKD